MPAGKYDLPDHGFVVGKVKVEPPCVASDCRTTAVGSSRVSSAASAASQDAAPQSPKGSPSVASQPESTQGSEVGVKTWLTAWIKANKNMYNKFAYRLNKLGDVKKTDWKRLQKLGDTQEAEQFILAVVEGRSALSSKFAKTAEKSEDHKETGAWISYRKAQEEKGRRRAGGDDPAENSSHTAEPEARRLHDPLPLQHAGVPCRGIDDQEAQGRSPFFITF